MLKTLFQCDACMGEGSWMGRDCTECHGKGYIVDPIDILVTGLALVVLTATVVTLCMM